MARGDPDLHHAISMKPSPFHHHPDRTSSPYSRSEPNISSPGTPVHHSHADKKAPEVSTSTALSSNDTEAQTATSSTAISRPTYHRHSSDSERDVDLERQTSSLPGYAASQDPYHLRSALRDIAQEKEAVRANIKRKRHGQPPPYQVLLAPVDRARRDGRRIIKFYEAQNENIERFLTSVDDHVARAKEQEGKDAFSFKVAVRGSFAANICLAVLQVYGAVSSGSLSLFTTMADAIFDPCSNLTLILCNRAISRVDPRRFPSGKGRLETAGNIAFCFLMTSVSLILIVESAQQLASRHDDSKFHIPSVVAVGIAFVTKLGLFLYCWALRNKYSQIRILWEDHRNDLFINGFGLMTSVLGSKIAWWIDPLGAIVLSILIAFLWMQTAYQEFQLLIGVSADNAFLKHVTYISMTHDPQIKCLDTVRAWHSGPRIIVEVDVVMDPDMSLKTTHDVAEDLQKKLESLPDVERAYVHVDYETVHPPEHFWKKEL